MVGSRSEHVSELLQLLLSNVGFGTYFNITKLSLIMLGFILISFHPNFLSMGEC